MELERIFFKLKSISIKRNYLIILCLLLLFSCLNQKEFEWKKKYFEQEAYRIEYLETRYKYNYWYHKESEEKYIKGFNSKNQLINYNNYRFYDYDSSGRIIKEVYCLRDCEIPAQELYTYGSNDLLIDKKICHPLWEDTIMKVQYEYDSNFLIKEIVGRKAPYKTIRYKYNNSGKLIKKDVREYNQNIDDWVEYYDTIYYDNSGKKIRQDYFVKGRDLQKITTYFYEAGKVVLEIDTTITTIKSYQLDLDNKVVYHSYYGKREFKYDSKGRLIKKIIYRPDYKTPYTKIEYSERRIKAH